MKNSNLALGLLGGVAAGTILGILFAPAKGSETRQTLADKGLDLNGNVKDSVSKLSSKIAQTITELKNDSQKFLGTANEVLSQDKTKLQNHVDINKSNVLG